MTILYIFTLRDMISFALAFSALMGIINYFCIGSQAKVKNLF